MAKFIDPSAYFGKRFGERTVLNRVRKGQGGNRFLLCRCDAGHESWVKLAHINAGEGGACKQCHCKRIAVRHGQAGSNRPAMTPTYRKWVDMRSRVKNDESYIRRGIGMCREWQSFERFLEDMGECPDPRMQIDRIDGTKGYSKNNCAWKTRLQNNRNRTNLRMLCFNGQTMCVADWEKFLNVPPDTLRKKLRYGRPLPQIMRDCGFTSKTLPLPI